MEKIKIKQFTKNGHTNYTNTIGELIDVCRTKGYTSRKTKELMGKVFELSKSATDIETIEGSKEIIYTDFENRLDLGKYLKAQLDGLERKKIFENARLWDWLAAFFINEIFSGRGLEQCRFAYNKDFRYGKKHLVRTAWLLYDRIGKDAAFCLSTPLHQHGNMCEQFISRMDLWKNNSVAGLCNKFYYDHDAKRQKKGADDHRKKKEDGETYYTQGAIYPRFYKEILTLSKNKDLWGLSSSEIEKLIRKEFSIWKTAKASTKKTGTKPPNWNRNETSIALKEYFNCTDKEEVLSDVKPIHEKISKILRSRAKIEHNNDFKEDKSFRNAVGVFRKFRNFAACDPAIEDEKYQDENYSKLDKELVSKFRSNFNELDQIVKTILTNKYNG